LELIKEIVYYRIG